VVNLGYLETFKKKVTWTFEGEINLRTIEDIIVNLTTIFLIPPLTPFSATLLPPHDSSSRGFEKLYSPNLSLMCHTSYTTVISLSHFCSCSRDSLWFYNRMSIRDDPIKFGSGRRFAVINAPSRRNRHVAVIIPWAYCLYCSRAAKTLAENRINKKSVQPRSNCESVKGSWRWHCTGCWLSTISRVNQHCYNAPFDKALIRKNRFLNLLTSVPFVRMLCKDSYWHW